MSFRILVVLTCLALVICPATAWAQEYLWCFESDTIVFDYNPDSDLLIIEHQAAMYNCCPEPVSYLVEQAEGIITVTELVGEENPCDCICCFNYKAEVTGFSPGFWTVRFTWRNEEDYQWLTEEYQLVIPGPGDPVEPSLLGKELSSCLEASAVPEDPEPVTRWGAVKSWYR